MSDYLIIEARDPYDSADVANAHALAAGLADQGSNVTMYLVQNGVFPAREGSTAAADLTALSGKIDVLADDFSLRERGITQLAEGVTQSSVDSLVDMRADGRKVIWH